MISNMDSAPDVHPHATVGSGRGGTYEWFDPSRAVEHAWGRHLPHWRQSGAIYFVTFRTDDSIPQDVVRAWQNERELWLQRNPPPRDKSLVGHFTRKFTRRMQRFLDDGHGACPFKEAGVRQCLIETIHARDGVSYALDGYVVMPNHVHVLVAPGPTHELSTIGKAWKSISAHLVNRLLKRRGALWQEESWDHLVRSPEHLDRYRKYIRRTRLIYRRRGKRVASRGFRRLRRNPQRLIQDVGRCARGEFTSGTT